MPPDFHPINFKQLIFLDVYLKILAHLEEITEEHLLSLLHNGLKGHLLNSHQVLLAIEVVNLSHSLLFEFRYVNNLRLLNFR